MFACFNEGRFYMLLAVLIFLLFVFLFVLHLICPENEMLMNGDYLYMGKQPSFSSYLLFHFTLKEIQGQSTLMCAAVWFN